MVYLSCSKIPKIVATFVSARSQGQRTHSARTNFLNAIALMFCLQSLFLYRNYELLSLVIDVTWGRGAGGVKLFVDSTTVLLSVNSRVCRVTLKHLPYSPQKSYPKFRNPRTIFGNTPMCPPNYSIVQGGYPIFLGCGILIFLLRRAS